MKLKKLIGILIVGTIGFFGYKYLVTNFSSEAMVYKRFANAVLDADPSRVRALATEDGTAMEAFKANTQRQDLINGEVRFTWYEFKDKRISSDGKHITLNVVQHMRVDPPGTDTFYGTELRSDRHIVVLKKFASSWQVDSFKDTPTINYEASQASR